MAYQFDPGHKTITNLIENQIKIKYEDKFLINPILNDIYIYIYIKKMTKKSN